MTNSTTWKAGQSGNPAGRPRKDTQALGEAELRKMLKSLSKVSDEAITKIIATMREGKTPEVQLTCAKWLVEKLIVVQKELDVKLNRANTDDEKVVETAPEERQAKLVLKMSEYKK